MYGYLQTLHYYMNPKSIGISIINVNTILVIKHSFDLKMDISHVTLCCIFKSSNYHLLIFFEDFVRVSN